MKRYDDYWTPRLGEYYTKYTRKVLECLDENKMLLRSSDDNFFNTANIGISFEDCQGEPDCLSPEEVKEYWRASFTNIFVMLES